MHQIPFNKPAEIGTEIDFVRDAISKGKLCGDGEYTNKCNDLLAQFSEVKKALLTTSCTHAIEMAAILAEIKPGDEVIMPSYTFVSTANPFVLRGAAVKFVDIEPNTLNININKIEAAITPNTKAIIPVHYAGIACDMDRINELASQYKLFVIEDAAQGVMSTYKGKPLGSIGDMGAFSFHETKNYHCGEGGAFLTNNEVLAERAEIIREKGTNRKKFLRGQVDKYTWVDVGSSYLPSELNAAFLYGQLTARNVIFDRRIALWNKYRQELKPLADKGLLELSYIPEYAEHNAHLFYIKLKNIEERSAMIAYAKDNGVSMVFHYIPLHSSIAGAKFGVFVGEDKYTTAESERLLRLPFYYSLTDEEQAKVIDVIFSFFKRLR